MFWPKEIWGRFADRLEDLKARPATCVSSGDWRRITIV